MFKNISPDLVLSGRTCLANLGVRSCPVRKLICPVRLSPTWQDNAALKITKISNFKLRNIIWDHVIEDMTNVLVLSEITTYL